ncbi:EF-hand domain-containing protein 1-like [Denticeps clupeoides]|uniref:DM10 domain-containing protein n=1 Tax=Denticeps clupeoides TaxID=299321 RepID=A0A8C4AF74_9TELE|nr:EF-hand domain-containing protein 1-like [Denticeps clupeoides]XP_028822316.1 EF-hand domain-containing protein 1-like [Denticeps clupeoides]
MSANTSHGFPFLPGNTFRDLTKTSYHKAQTLSYKNGYAVPKRPQAGIGQSPLVSQQLTHNEIKQLTIQTAAVSHTDSSRTHPPLFCPAYVSNDKKVLHFSGFLRQEVQDSPDELYRIRPVDIYYYLVDDTMCVIEPAVENSGIPQGKLVKRQRLPMNDRGDHYHWKHLNLGTDLCAYGTTYHITHCDAYTQEFMESQGIVLNEPESVPSDPYLQRRVQPQQSYIPPADSHHLKRFLTLDRKVLCFFALWDDTDSLYGESRPVTIHYYLVDNTVEIRESYQPNCGRDPFPVLLRRQSVPKDFKPSCESFPSCVLEISSQEVQEYYSPEDFKVGETIRLLGRSFKLYDCDAFTRSYYQHHHPDINLKPVQPEEKALEDMKREIPPYNGFGSLEDSLQNCLSLVPEPPKKNLMKLLENDHKVLRYAAKLDSQNPQDEGRQFILSYFLSNDMISIFETSTRNSGIIGGKFLEKTRVPKPDSNTDNPQFYSPSDFAIGATVEVFRHRFVLTDADHYVLKYLETEGDKVPQATLNSIRQKLKVDTSDPMEKYHEAEEAQ